MGIATTLKQYLHAKGIQFSRVEHPYAEGSFNTANAANIEPRCLAKAVLFRDEDFNYTLAVVPSCNKVMRYTINQIFDRHMELADEEEIKELFRDCLPGAVPPVGQAYDIDVIWDEELAELDYIWIEAGDHENLIGVEVKDFQTLMANSLHDHFSTNRRYRKPPKPTPESYQFTPE